MKMAVIPARGGSKRIPRKNIKDFCGKPMIAYAICAAKESGLFDRIVVSTEDDEIAEIANQWGAETPFKRPIELSDDYTATVPVIKHSIETCKNQGWIVKEVCCVYPCVPFLQAVDLIGGFSQMKKNVNEYSLSITEYPSAIQRALKRLRNEKLEPFFSEFENVRTQDLDAAYYDAGQFYWGRTEQWLSTNNIHSNGIGYEIPRWRSVDIDTPEDWQYAEILYQKLNQKKDNHRGLQ
jgi:pseudaminic acid cytidylyltransferase